MWAVTHPTGCVRETTEHSRELRANRRYLGAVETLTNAVQEIPRIREQKTPDCVGQSLTSAIHGLTGFDGSAIQVWAGARRRDGLLADAQAGTTVSLAIDEVEQRGIAEYSPGEEDRVEEHTRRPSIADELDADDRRFERIWDHHVVDGSIDEQRSAIVHALSSGRGVIWTTGVTDAFMRHPANTMVQAAEVGIDYNGHAMRVAAYVASLDAGIVQNSWGESWAGIVALDHQYRGCCAVPMDVLIRAAWETWIIQVQP